MRLTALPKELDFWNRFAPYYELWASRTTYHRPIVAELSSMVEPGWRVLDIGAATGILSIPLASLGCHVTALEPSEGMRKIFTKKLSELNVKGVEILPLRLEDYHVSKEFNLILASNSLHLIEGGILEGTKKVFREGPEYFCLVTEIEGFPVDFKAIDELADGYEFLYIKTYETDSSLCPDKEQGFIDFLEEYISDMTNIKSDKTKLSVLWWERK